MCLINDLARFNKMQHQYRLTDEAGKFFRQSITYNNVAILVKSDQL